MIVGCKLDLIDKLRAQYLLINSKVLKCLKFLDPDQLTQYCEMGIPHSANNKDHSYRLIPNHELNIFISKVFGPEIKLDTHLDNEFEAPLQTTKSIENISNNH
jgi:hypothetical protein